MDTSVDGWPRRVRLRIRSHKAVYWVSALFILGVGVWLDTKFDAANNLLSIRYWIFRQMTQLEWRPLEPRFTRVVLIGDDDYYNDPINGRTPTPRDYLAALVSALDRADAELIALDFDVGLRKRGDTGRPGAYSEIPNKYRNETDMLIRTIGQVAQHRQIVLSKLLWFGDQSSYRLRPDTYGPYGICVGLNRDGSWQNPGTSKFPLTKLASENISCGYINLPYDRRLLPPRVSVGPGAELPSFALAIASDISPQITKGLEADTYYGSYIPPAVREQFHVVFAAGDLLKGKAEVVGALRHHPVLVGGAWHRDGVGLGPGIDTYNTPIGPEFGTLIHQNFVEAILDGRSYRYVSDRTLHVLELLFGVVSIFVFASFSSFPARLFALAILSVVLLFLQFGMLITIGTFFDAFIPLFGLWCHSLFDRVLGTRETEYREDADHASI